MPNDLTRGIITLLLCLAAAAPAVAEEKSGELVQATLLADVETLVPGETFTLGVHLKMAPHWHTYWINPGETGDATKITLTGPAGFTFGEIHWPLPTKIDAPGGISYGYENDVLLMVPVTVAKDASLSAPAKIDAKVSWLVCKETCIKGKAEVTISLPIGSAPKPANADLFSQWKRQLPVAIDTPAAKNALAGVDQPAKVDGSNAASLAVRWKQPPKKVEWFPVSTRAVAVENVVVRHGAQETEIEFRPTVYDADTLKAGRIDSVLVYEDATGVRHGISVPVQVSAAQ